MSAIVVSDLDGTLLDHDSYSFEAARPALERLRQSGIPVVLNTSKTYAETSKWVAAMQLQAPFIVENGGAIHHANGQLLKSHGQQRASLLQWLNAQAEKTAGQIRSFADMSHDEIAACTGLSLDQAHLAAQRKWSEPLQWRGDEAGLQTFMQHAQQAGYFLIKGGRFWSLQGEHDKAEAMQALPALLKLPWPARIVALGDGPNDARMLAAADLGVWIRSQAHQAAQELRQSDQLISTNTGPAGWNEIIMQLFEQGFFKHG